MTPAVLAASVAWAAAMAYLVRLPLAPGDRAKAPAFGPLFCAIAAATCLPFICRTPSEAAGRAATLGMLVATGAVDYRTGYIFDFATLPSAAISLAVAVATGSVSPAAHALFSIGVPIGALAAWSRGTWIAWGDIKAIFSIVIAFGVTESLLTLIVASLSGILHARALGARSIPFGPHMALGAAIAVAVGPLLDPILMEG